MAVIFRVRSFQRQSVFTGAHPADNNPLPKPVGQIRWIPARLSGLPNFNDLEVPKPQDKSREVLGCFRPRMQRYFFLAAALRFGAGLAAGFRPSPIFFARS